MHNDLVELGWTEHHWNRIRTAVSEEAQKARVGAQMLNVVGPEEGRTVAVPAFTLGFETNPQSVFAASRLAVDSNPTLFLTKLAVNVYLHAREAADPDLSAALLMFRRAANYIARIEDALIFNGRPGPSVPPPYGLQGLPLVYQVTGDGAPEGLFPFLVPGRGRTFTSVPRATGATRGDKVISAIIQSIDSLDSSGQLGPYACALSSALFRDICTPNANLVLPRDRILPFLEGPLLRSSAVFNNYGIVVALSASPIELVVASDIDVQFLQINEEPRLVFRVSERVALRIKQHEAIAILTDY